ncbi:MAG: hypothetical protein V3T30_08810, partial [Thermodesulfobacteriota bacterium]
ILLLDFNDYAQYKSISEIIETLDVVKKVSVNSFMQSKIVLTAEVWGNLNTLFETLNSEKVLGDVALIPGGNRSIIIKAARKISNN